MLQNVIVPHLQASQDVEGYLNHLQEYHKKTTVMEESCWFRNKINIITPTHRAKPEALDDMSVPLSDKLHLDQEKQIRHLPYLATGQPHHVF
jgi:hypothetical protein